MWFAALHATKLFLHGDECPCAPAQLLIACPPVIDATGLVLYARHHALDQICRLEARAELGEHAEPVQRQGLAERFLETPRRLVHDPQVL